MREVHNGLTDPSTRNKKSKKGSFSLGGQLPLNSIGAVLLELELNDV